jgi:hypothetical protein
MTPASYDVSKIDPFFHAGNLPQNVHYCNKREQAKHLPPISIRMLAHAQPSFAKHYPHHQPCHLERS